MQAPWSKQRICHSKSPGSPAFTRQRPTPQTLPSPAHGRAPPAATQIIRGEVREEELPPLREYLASAAERASAVQAVQAQASSEGALRRLMNGGGAAGGLPGWFNRQQ